MNRTEFIGTELYYSQEFVDDMKNNYEQEIERLNNIINKALRKLRASKDHFKTENENNAVTFTIKILEEVNKQ